MPASEAEIIAGLAEIIEEVTGIEPSEVTVDKSFVDDLDIDFANSISIIEWGRGFTDGLSDSWLDIEIERDHTGETELREVAIIGNGTRWANVPAADFAISEVGA